MVVQPYGALKQCLELMNPCALSSGLKKKLHTVELHFTVTAGTLWTGVFIV